MAHDFMIRHNNNEDNREHTAVFCGYCNGVMYKAFGMQHHDMVVSGDGFSTTLSVREAKAALDWAIEYFDNSEYPDPHRMDSIKRFRREMDTDTFDDNGCCTIWFG